MKITSEQETSVIVMPEKEVQSVRPERGYSECTTIHSGAFSLLLKAKRDGRWWCLKTISQSCQGDNIYARLLEKEYAILSMLQHPGIVQALCMEDVPPFGRCIMMEYVDGDTLDSFLLSNPSRATRLDIAMQLLDAMEYVHAKQVVHRDLKPQNIIITHNGHNVKIVDFGLSDTDSHHILKQPAGTPTYMSPEQRS